MNRKRLGQLLIGGVFTACALVISSLMKLVKQEESKPDFPDEASEENEEQKWSRP